MKKITILPLVVTFLLVGACLVPTVASAQSISVSASVSGSSSISGLEEQIAALLSQLATLRTQLHVAVGSSTPPFMQSSTMISVPPFMPAPSSTMIGSSTNPGGPLCPVFNRNLSIGVQGSDVMQLQTMLVQDANFPQGDVTGYFGPITAKALANFQMANGIASSSSATGFFGPLTRSFFMKRCLMLPGSNGGAVPPPASDTMPMPLPFQPGGPMLPPTGAGANGSSSAIISPSSGPVGTSVTISGIANISQLGTTETVLMDGLAAAKNVSVAADGSVSFTVPMSLAPNCGPGQACPQFLMVTSPRSYQVSLVGQDDVNADQVSVGAFTVTDSGAGNGSSTIMPGTFLPL